MIDSPVTDWGALYRDHVRAVTALVGGLDDEQLARTVAGTPSWTVREVLCHLAGGAADSVTGRTDGAPGPEWTARHVAERVALPLDEVSDELTSHQDAVAASTLDNPRPAIVWDIAVHHADLHEELGLGPLPERFWRPVQETVEPMLLGRAEGAAPDALASVAAYERFRALFSRRSRAQMRAWGTSLSPEALEALCIFGPRDDDQPLPT